MDLNLWNKYPTLKNKLEKVQKIMIDQIELDDHDFQSGIEELINGNGKMLRSALLLLFTSFGNDHDDNDHFEKVAASIELIHLASLVHDDVIDRSDLRRGVKSLNYDFGQRTAIYLGDFLFVKYFQLVLNVLPDISKLKYNISGIQSILDGELNQNSTMYDIDRTEKQYFKSIRGKTAELFRVATGNGAIISDADDSTIKLAEKIGLQIGMAFQIRDDLIDFKDNEQKAGKPTLHDVYSGVYTLPIIYTLQSSFKAELIKILKQKQLKNTDLSAIKNMVEQSGALKRTQNVLDSYRQSIDYLMHELPSNQSQRIVLKLIHKLFK